MANTIIDIRATIPRHPTKKWKQRNTADAIVVHTTASSNQDPNKTARYHIHVGQDNHLSATGAPGLAYHDFITKKGEIYHCNDYTDITWHASSYNTRSVGVTMAYRGWDQDKPEEAQFEALLEHLVDLCLGLKILPSRVFGHREVPGMFTILPNGTKQYKKGCPGMSVNLDSLRRQVTQRLQARLAEEYDLVSLLAQASMPDSLVEFVPVDWVASINS